MSTTVEMIIPSLRQNLCWCRYECTIDFAPFGPVRCELFLKLDEAAPGVVDFSYAVDLTKEQSIQLKEHGYLLERQKQLVAQKLDEMKGIFQKTLTGKTSRHNGRLYWNRFGGYKRFGELIALTLMGHVR